MNILLVNGVSGVGKTTLARALVEKYPDKYNFVKSYTTRAPRNKDDDHIFIDKKTMIVKMLNHQYIARTTINDNIYCAFRHQFSNSKINIYIVDDWGVIDALNSLRRGNTIKVVRVLRNDVVVDQKRRNRFSSFIPNSCPHISKIIRNDNDLDVAVEEINNIYS